jgi:hypothetical protein
MVTVPELCCEAWGWSVSIYARTKRTENNEAFAAVGAPSVVCGIIGCVDVSEEHAA